MYATIIIQLEKLATNLKQIDMIMMISKDDDDLENEYFFYEAVHFREITETAAAAAAINSIDNKMNYSGNPNFSATLFYQF